MDANRAKQHSGERPVTMAPHDEEVSFLRLIDQYLGRMSVTHLGLDRCVRPVRVHLGDRLGEIVAHLLLGLLVDITRCYSYRGSPYRSRIVPGPNRPNRRACRSGITSRPAHCRDGLRRAVHACHHDLPCFALISHAPASPSSSPALPSWHDRSEEHTSEL